MRKLALLGFVLALGLSCNVQYEDVFLIGEQNNLLFMTTLNPAVEMVVGGYLDLEYTIDLDQDGEEDLVFKGSSAVAASGNEWNDWAIEALTQECEFACEEVTHTFKVCSHTADEQNYFVYYSDKYLYNCTHLESNDNTTEKIWTPIVYSLGDQVDATVDWFSAKTFLTEYAYTDDYTAHDEDDPNWSAWYKVYGNWPDVKDKYLLVRLKQEQTYYYGWIKLSFGGTNHIKIMEFAISEY